MKKCESTGDLFSPKMEPAQIKKILKYKGWLAKEVAERWGILPRRMSQIIQDPNRKQYYDDAISGLPIKNYNSGLDK